MREATKNILYTVVNSRAYAPENLKTGMASWKILMIVCDCVFAALMICLMSIFCKNFKKNRANEKAAEATVE